MSIGAITDAVHDEKFIESTGTEEEKTIRHVNKRKIKNSKEQTERYSKTRTNGLQLMRST